MKSFITDDFLLGSDTARELYHSFAADEPVFDYHSHLSPRMIADDSRLPDIAQLWLSADHYKWRAMRTNGVAEEYVTGGASLRDKFQKWAETVPYTAFNPLHHWTHLELLRIFGIDDILDGDSAASIYGRANELLSADGYSVRGIIRRMKVKALCTTDDPSDDLSSHKIIASEINDLKVLPTFRPDRALAIENASEFRIYCDTLGESAGLVIKTFDDFLAALRRRHDFFHKSGCRSCDCSFNRPYASDFNESSLSSSFSRARAGKMISADDASVFRSAVFYVLGVMNAEKGWVQQYHIGPIRNASSRLFTAAGSDIGCDSMNDEPVAKGLSRMLDRLDREGKLPKTILYNLNPAASGVIASMCGNFQDGSFPGKIQFGPGWWFLDQKKGIEEQMEVLAAMGLLSRFTGMVTDSRSFLSFTRHEYFRRILCSWVGSKIENGEAPRDLVWFGRMVKDISFGNSVRYFGLEL